MMEQQMQMQNHSSSSSSSSKADRKTIEKNRRNHMKSLFSQLSSRVPHHSREVLSLPDQLGEATSYIKKLQIKLERFKERKENLINAGSTVVKPNGDATVAKTINKQPEIEIHEIGSAIQVIMITGRSGYQFMFSEAIRVLHEEKAEVLKASYTVNDNTVFHIIHSKIAEFEQHYGATRRISEKLKKIVYDK